MGLLDGINHAIDTVKETVSNAAETVKEGVSSAVEAVEEKVSEIAQSVKEVSVFCDDNKAEAAVITQERTSVFEKEENQTPVVDEVSFSTQKGEVQEENKTPSGNNTNVVTEQNNTNKQQGNSGITNEQENTNKQSNSDSNPKEPPVNNKTDKTQQNRTNSTLEKGDAAQAANEFYKIADDNSGLTSIGKMQELLDGRITSDNIMYFLDAYEKSKQGDSSIIDTIISETGGNDADRKKLLSTIMDKLSENARKSGVSEEDIKKARTDYERSMDKEFGTNLGIVSTLKRINPKDMEKSMDFLRGAILQKSVDAGQELSDDISESEAIKMFQAQFKETSDNAANEFERARNEEEWAAKLGDSALGLLGYTTIEEMREKLGENAKDVEKLLNSKNDEEFKKNYKETFGVDFDSKKIAAMQSANEKYQQAYFYSEAVKSTDEIMKNAKTYEEMKSAIKDKLNFNDEMLNEVIKQYGDNAEALKKYLNDTKASTSERLKEISGGKTLEQLGKDAELLTQSTLGTSNIAKDVAVFNANQELTGIAVEAGAEIAATVALQLVPGAGQLAAARLAANAAKWGSKGLKIAQMANKAEKGFSAMSKLQKGTMFESSALNKAGQIGSQMAAAGIATMGVDLSNGRTAEEAIKKSLMNMGFAGVGATSSMLAPKLMQTFGLSNQAATEVAEQIMNAAGSAGIVKASGSEYGKTDAMMDFATGLIMSRISHVNNSTKISDSSSVSGGTSKSKHTPKLKHTPVEPFKYNGGGHKTQLMPNFPHTNGNNATIMPGMTSNYQKFEKGMVYHITPDEFKDGQLILAGGMNALDLNDKLFLQKFNALKEGESFTVGSWDGNADYKIGSKNLGVSREHLTVMKDHGRLLIRDNSKNGTSIRRNWQSSISPQEVSALFPNNQIPFNHTIDQFYKQLPGAGFSSTLDAIDYQNMAKLMNVCNGKYIHTWKGTCWSDNIQNMSKLAVLEKILRKNNAIGDFMKLGPHEWDLVVNSTCQKDPLTMDALLTYKNGSGAINGMLTAQKNGKNWNNPLIQEQIDKLTKFLDTQTVNKKIKLYRGEGYNGIMDTIKTKNGQSLGQVMQNLVNSGASEKDILKFIDEELLSRDIKQERFMSTSLTRNFSATWGGPDTFLWEFSAPAGTKAAFCEDFDLAYNMNENEVLVQRGSVLSITGARFDKTLHKWVISATIKQK